MLYNKDMRNPSWLEENKEWPEAAVVRLAKRLARQDLFDILVAALPPLAAALYLVEAHFSLAGKEAQALLFIVAAVASAAFLVVVARRRAGGSRFYEAARLLDDRVGGKDRFVTLATLGSSDAPYAMVAQLRREAAALAGAVNFGKEFPYRAKRSFFVSLAASVIVVLSFYLWPRVNFQPFPGAALVRQAADELSEIPYLADVAPMLHALADRLQDSSVPPDDETQLAQERSENVPSEAERSRVQGNQDDDSARSSEGPQGSQRDAGKGAGEGEGVKANLPQDGQGSEKRPDSGDRGAAQKPAASGEKSSGGEEKRQAERDAGGSDDSGHGGEKMAGKSPQAGREPESTAGRREGSGGVGGKVGEEIPKGPAPDRYLKPGEKSGEGLQNGRFVTVQLPEELAGDSTGGSDSDKRREVRPRLPVANVPLSRPAAPDPLPERQHVPLEYRGRIR